MRSLLLACVIVAAAGCADPPRGAVPSSVQAATAAIQLAGGADEVSRWQGVCAALGDPVVEPPALPPGDAPHVSFVEQHKALGLPAELVTSAASAGRLGDRLALLLPGHLGGTRTTPGPPSVDLYLRCGTQFHALNLPERVTGAPPQVFEGPFRASAIWDADSDGRADLLLASLGRDGQPAVSIFYNEPTGGFRYAALPGLPAASRVKSLTPIDLNHDGVLDLHVALQNYKLQVAADHAAEPEYDRLVLFGADRAQFEVTEAVAGIDTLGGRVATSSFVCVPPLAEGRGRLCWQGRQNAADRLFEEVAPMTFEPLDAELPVGATASVTALPDPFSGGIVFAGSNLGRPVVVRVDADYRVHVISDQVPMQVLGLDTRIRTGPNRGRIGWGLVYDYFSNRDCPGLVIANAVTGSEEGLPTHDASGLVYYARWCVDGDWGDRFFNTSTWAGEAFTEAAIRDYYQVLVVHANEDTCPDMLVTAQPWRQSDPDHLLGDPPEVRLLINRCDTPGNRVSVRLMPEDYAAQVTITLDDDTERTAFLKAPGLAGTHDPVISLGLGHRRATRVCVDWSDSSAWSGTRRTCVDDPASDRLVTLIRPLR